MLWIEKRLLDQFNVDFGLILHIYIYLKNLKSCSIHWAECYIHSLTQSLLKYKQTNYFSFKTGLLRCI